MLKDSVFFARVFDGVKTRQHGEHIIQNAIGGALISEEIFVRPAVFGRTVDTPFATALAPLTVLLDLYSRDRGDYSRVGATIAAKTEEAPLEGVQFTL